MEIFQSLINKLMEENEYGIQQIDSDFFNRLEEDEVEVLEELLEQVEFYVDVGGPLLIFLIPVLICWIRRRI